MIQIQGITIPIDGGDDYTTPEMQKAMDFYPEYAALCEKDGIMPHTRRGYLIGVCNAVAKSGVIREGKRRQKDEILHRVFEHFGLTRISEWFDAEE